MIRSNPKLTYSGLTVVVSNPSRFDTVSLCSANGGVMFNKHCLQPEFNSMMCEFRCADDSAPLREGTKCVLLMGEYAMHKWIPSTSQNKLNEMRGSPLRTKDGIPAIASFFYQDCVDIVNWEGRLNEDSHSYIGAQHEKEETNEDVKSYGETARSNYAFWLRQDTKKCKEIIRRGGQYPSSSERQPTYVIYPPAETCIDILQSTRDAWIDFDMETDYVKGNPYCRNVQCFAFSVDNGHTIYAVPVLAPDYKGWAYTKTPQILKAFNRAASRNIVVAHNGAAFDFPVLFEKLGIIVKKPWDTMLSQHRIFPDVEKSLGHCVSLWLWEKFHKDENPGKWYTQDDMMRTLRYCAKDVRTMSLVRQEQYSYAQRIPGLWDSIQTVQRAIRPYLTMSMQGIQYDESMRASKAKENDRLMMHYLKYIEMLIGSNGMKDVRSSIKSTHPGAFPGSNPQCCRYFHDLLGYKIQQRGKVREDGKKHPSLAAKAMYRLRLQYDNPVIDFSIAYRQTKLETSTPLGFLPWLDDNNNHPIPEDYAPLIKGPTSTL